MSQTQTTLSPQAVTEAIEADLVESSLMLARTEDAVAFRGSDVAWVYTGTKALNRVLRPRFSPSSVEERVDEISECFRNWDAPVTWIVGPTTWPPQLGEVLFQSGYGSHDTWTGMALDLTQWSVDPNLETDLQVDRATDRESLADWARLGTDPEAESSVEIFSPDHAGGDPRCRYYLGYWKGNPVSRCMSFLRDETVGLYWVGKKTGTHGTEPDRAVIAKALHQARAGGAITAVVPATEAVRGTLTEMGFKAYCQFNVYSWPPEPIKMPIH